METPIRPLISCDGYYAYCPICGYFDLFPEHSKCPKCSQILDWNWLKELDKRIEDK